MPGTPTAARWEAIDPPLPGWTVGTPYQTAGNAASTPAVCSSSTWSRAVAPGWRRCTTIDTDRDTVGELCRVGTEAGDLPPLRGQRHVRAATQGRSPAGGHRRQRRGGTVAKREGNGGRRQRGRRCQRGRNANSVVAGAASSPPNERTTSTPATISATAAPAIAAGIHQPRLVVRRWRLLIFDGPEWPAATNSTVDSAKASLSACTKSPADAGRSAASFDSPPASTRSTASGTGGPTPSGAGDRRLQVGRDERRASSRPGAKGDDPASSSNAVHASEYTSERASSSAPWICSGDAYSAVPRKRPCCVAFVLSAMSFVTPKSTRYARMRGVSTRAMRTLAGLTSRCTN